MYPAWRSWRAKYCSSSGLLAKPCISITQGVLGAEEIVEDMETDLGFAEAPNAGVWGWA
jgi:hypothetical protein